MSKRVGMWSAGAVALALVACSPGSDGDPAAQQPTPSPAATEPATATQEATTQPTSETTEAELRELVDDAVSSAANDVTPEMCADWEDRRESILDLMTETIVDNLQPLQPGDPDQIVEISGEAISEQLDAQCEEILAEGEETVTSGMAAAAGLEPCNEPWATTDHVGNDFTVTVCTTSDGQTVSLYEFDRSQYTGMVREYTETAHVAPTWAVAASSQRQLGKVLARLGGAGWAGASGQRPAQVEEPPAPESETDGWDVVNGNYYATVTRCPIKYGVPTAVVKVLNDGPRDADVTGTVEVIDLDTDERVSEMYYYAERVRPGQTVSVDAVGFEDVPDNRFCVALSVEPMD